jgi:hypothetical protein
VRKKAPRREGRRGAAARPGWGARMSALNAINTDAPALFPSSFFYFRPEALHKAFPIFHL